MNILVRSHPGSSSSDLSLQLRFFVYAVYISTSGSGKEHERGKDELRLNFFREITKKKKTSPQFSGFARVACWRRNVKLFIVISRSNFCNKTISGHFIKTACHIYFPRSAR